MSDEFARFAQLVRRNIAGRQRLCAQQHGEAFGIETIVFDGLIADETNFSRVSDGDIKMLFETIVDEPVVAGSLEGDVGAFMFARELFEFVALGFESLFVWV